MPLLLSLLLCYAPDTVWASYYDGPVSAEDRATVLLADSLGNCWLAGYSFGGTVDFDFCTARFDTAGDTVWTRRYGSPHDSEDRIWAASLDREGSVVACGGSIAAESTGWDFVVAKYRPDGGLLWLRRVDFPGHGDDKPVALAILPDNSILVAGESKHRPDSTRGTSRTDSDVAVARLSTEGDTLWTRLFDAAGRDDNGTAAAADTAGNCFVAAKSARSSGTTDIVLLAYRPDGSRRGVQFTNGAGGGNDLPTGLLLDPTGRVFVLGTVTGKGTSFDYFLACYGSDLRLLWSRTFDSDGRVDIAQAAALDQDGNIIVTGQSTGRGSSFDIVTLRYSPRGDLLWKARYNGPQGGADHGRVLAVKPDGQVVVAGTSEGVFGYADLALLCYSREGEVEWSWRYSGGGTGEARPVGVNVRGDRLYVGGYACRPATGFDYLLLCLEERGR